MSLGVVVVHGALRPFRSPCLLPRPFIALMVLRCWRFSCCFLFCLGLKCLSISESIIRTDSATSDRFSLSTELDVSNSSSVFSPLMASSPQCLVGFGSLLRLLPLCPLPDFSVDPPSSSSADPNSNSASDSVLRSLPLLSCSLAQSLETLLPLKCGTSR